jgi:hypothetical protein
MYSTREYLVKEWEEISERFELPLLYTPQFHTLKLSEVSPKVSSGEESQKIFTQSVCFST